MIEEVELRNWKSHLDSKLEFGPGTNVLVGIMGSGKSSVLSAISFALFGTFPSLRSRQVTLDEVVMNRPYEKEEAEVKVIFSVDGERFTVERKIEKGKGTTEAKMRKNGELVDTGASRVTELVEKYLKVDYDLFSRAVYSEQDGLDYFLEIQRGKRMKRIDSLLRIDLFEKCRKNTTTAINRLKERIESHREFIERMEEEEDFEKIKELEDKLEELEKGIEDKKGKLKDIREKYKKNKEELKEIKKEVKDKRKLEKKKNNISGAISNIKEDLDSFSFEKEEDEEKLLKTLARKKKGLKDLKSNKKDLKEEKKELKGKIEEKRVKISDLQKRIQKVKQVEGRCPICDSKLDEEHRKRVVAERREKISDLANSKEELEEKQEELEEKIEDLEIKMEERKKEKEKIEKRLEKVEQYKKKKKRLEEKQEELEKIENKLKKREKKVDERKIEQKQKKLEELSSQKSKISSELKHDRKFYQEKEKQKERLTKRKEKFQEYREEATQLREIKQDLTKFRTALQSTQKKLRKRFVEAVNKTMEGLWDDLYPYNDFTGIRLTIRESDYELQLRSGDRWRAVEGVASGGERTTACLALRIAFALVLAPNLKWLILDEPTHNLDGRAVEDLAELLRTRVSEFVDQVFLITHDEKMEGAVNSNLYRLKRKKEKNEATEVEEVSSL